MMEECVATKRPLEKENEPPEGDAGNASIPHEPEAKKQRTESPAVARDAAAILKQIEYYFSDENLRHDQFFHEKMSADPEGWLDMKLIMSCKKIIAMKVDTEEVVEALKPSGLEIKKDDTSTWIRRTRALPTLELKKKKDAGKKVSSVHEGGCIAKVIDIPEEVAWTAVKDQVKLKLPEGARLRFVSQVDDASCFIFAKPFENSEEFFKTCEFDINGVTLRTQLADDVDARQALARKLPKAIKRDRDRDVARGRQGQQKARQKVVRQPVTVAGTRFDSFEHLRQCLKEVISAAKPFVPIEESAASYKVVKELIEYHPRADAKKQDWAGLRIGLMASGGQAIGEHEVEEASKNGKITRCFFVVRTDGTAEDFSVHKCIEELARRTTAEAAEKSKVGTPPSSSSQEIRGDVEAEMGVQGEEGVEAEEGDEGIRGDFEEVEGEERGDVEAAKGGPAEAGEGVGDECPEP